MEDVEFIITQIYHEFEFPLHYYNAAGRLCHACGYPDEKQDPFRQDAGLYQILKDAVREEPALFREDEALYGILADEKGNMLIVGPVSISELSPLQLARYCGKHSVEKKDFFIRRTNLIRLANLLSLLLFFLKRVKMDEHEIIEKNSNMVKRLELSEKEYLDYQMDHSEQGTERLSYGFEKKWLEAVRTGNLELIYGGVTSQNASRIGTMAKQGFKQLEYACVCSITLATRAAIEGGVKPLEAYTVSDLYLQKLERAKGQEDIIGIMDKMLHDFAERIRQQQEDKVIYDYVEKCKDYVTRHINEKIVISEIAASIPVNASYLSRKFSEQEGMTIQRYIAREKTRAAANMLRFSEYRLSEIAQYLGFSTQSNMAKQFKEFYGMSPMEYRRKNQVVDFVSRTDV